MASVPNGMLLAQVMPDETLGNEGSLFIDGGVRDRIEGGATRGENLFHSFEEFNVNTGQEVYFANPVGIETILSRVTGTNLSEIDGLLGVDGAANLFLLNPNGIMFGPNAELDIRGSFTASTADTYQFEGAADSVDIQGSDFLTMSVPLGVQRGMKPQGDVTNEGSLAVDAGQSLTLFGDTVLSSGSLAAPAGWVEVLGNRVGLIDQALIDVSGDAGGGTVLVGGDYQGQGDVPNAERTYVGSDVVINVDALTTGDGGQVIVWADGMTHFAGHISAQGGTQQGNGGFVEVSGLEFLDFNGEANTQAINGNAGSVLLDPRNITISDTPPAGFTSVGAEDVVLDDFFYEATEDSEQDSHLTPATVNSLLGTNDLTLAASNDINWNANATLTHNTERTLELQANGSIFLNEQSSSANTSLKIESENAPLNVILNAERDGLGEGGTIILRNAQIFSNGGDIILRGGSESLNDIILDITHPSEITNVLEEGTEYNSENNGQPLFAPETLARDIFTRGVDGNSRFDGIGLDRAIIDAGSGNILLLGGGSEGGGFENRRQEGVGIKLIGDTQIRTSDSGQIRLIGLGGLGIDNNIGNDRSGATQGILISGDSSISSENGDIQLTGYAAGFDEDFDPFTNGKVDLAKTWTDVGVWIRAEVFSSGSGDIYVTGISDARTSFNNEGIAASTGSAIRADGTGNISLHGIGGLGERSGTNPGIHISSTASSNGSRVETTNGDISLIGVGRATGPENYGVQLNARGLIRAGGNISIEGTGGPSGPDPVVTRSLPGLAEGIHVASDSGGIESNGSRENTIALTADEIVLQGQDQVRSNGGILILQPKTPNLRVVVGGTSEDEMQLNLGARDLEALKDGFSKIQIGLEEASEQFPVIVNASATFQDSVEIWASSIDTSNNATILSNGDFVKLISEGNIQSPNIIASGQEILLKSEHGGNISLESSSILAPPMGSQGSSIFIDGHSLIMREATIDAINSQTLSNSISVSPTSISIDVDDLVSLENSSILSITNGAANAGRIRIVAGNEVSLDGLSRISSISLKNASGDGGDISIEANRLSLENNSQISSSTFSENGGNAGNIEIDVTDRVIISGVGSNGPERDSFVLFDGEIFPQTPKQKNDVNFSDVIAHVTRDVEPSETVSSYTLEVSSPGTSAIFDIDNGFSLPPEDPPENVTEFTRITENNTLSILNAAGVTLASNAGVPDSFGAEGSTNSTDPYIRYTFREPGTYFIQISTRRLEEKFEVINLTDFDRTEVLTEPPSNTDLKRVKVNPTNPPTLHVSLLDTSFESQSGLFSTTSNQGSAGEISISTPQLNISNGGQVSVLTNNNGTGGTIKIESDEINLSDNGSEILASTTAAASGGSIVLQPNTGGDIEINTIGDGPQISASTAPGSSGTGGNITIRNAEIAKLDNTELLTSSNGSGRAGNINVQNVDVLLMRRGSLIQAGASSTGSGGEVDIDAGFVVTVPNENNDILANARENAGGNIDITANRIIGFREVDQFSDRLRENGLSDISARSRLGTDGEVDINNLFIDPNQGLNELPSTLVDPANRIAQGCRAAQTDQPEETSAAGDFIITGRGGQSSDPANPGSSDITPLDDFGPIDAQTNATTTATAISETDSPKELKDSQAAIMTESGDVFLVASDGWDSSISCSNLR
ncbi:MAG: filamentous hemagglutinin N-terminal domain-containing protein [Cyanobacteria bacterium J06627_3]